MIAGTRQIRSKGRDVQDLLRGYILSLPCIGFALFSGAFVAFTTPGGLLEAHPIWLRLAVNFGHITLFLGFSYAVLPMLFRKAFAAGWPILWVQIASYLGLSVLVAANFALLDGAALYSWTMAFHFATVLMITAISVIVGLLLFWVVALPKAGIDVTPAQLWYFRPVGDCRLQPHLSFDTRGRVLRLTAENQYVRVLTDNGEELLRMTLAEAADLVPPETGLRIHRSHWVAKDQFAALRFESGNPRLTLVDGQNLPVSRNMVEAIRDILSARSLPAHAA
ncbi:LytTR family DNA-binding domain-containing protein [Maritimibacter sp. DP1N21-5]|uniref:LytTR family DNA-binding domain-containing protein n=1 Tax=Maritimibacter sp. DP1N21-5 TaxID=2836867 RepID=UPI001C45F699|nr:LytTR family DNA-binding domain-containing protein [Maritimibacter sp. DP1N21-5]MBV7408158.1 LytTR family transcriptional regulator [Maritimibacter sp. DP1N21-5]